MRGGPQREQARLGARDMRGGRADALVDQCDLAERLAALQSRLKCGTQCGSCLPAVKALLRSHRQLEPST